MYDEKIYGVLDITTSGIWSYEATPCTSAEEATEKAREFFYSLHPQDQKRHIVEAVMVEATYQRIRALAEEHDIDFLETVDGIERVTEEARKLLLCGDLDDILWTSGTDQDDNVYTCTFDDNNGVIVWCKGRDFKTVKEMEDSGHYYCYWIYSSMEDENFESPAVFFATPQYFSDCEERGYTADWRCSR